MRWAFVVALLASGACQRGKASHAATDDLRYRLVPMTGQQASALSQFAHRQMTGGVDPADVAMVVSPQPADTPKGKLLLAVRYSSCGHSLGRVVLTDGTLVIEKNPPRDAGSGLCGGRNELTGMLVTLPRKATVRVARVQPASS
jgi:hypothetical protein